MTILLAVNAVMRMNRHLAHLAMVSLLGAAPLVSCSKAPKPTPVCTFAIAPASHTIPAEGATRTVTVTASEASCAWTAGPSVTWIGLPAGGSGTGSGTFDYVVPANPATEPRSGGILIGGQTHAVTQEGQQVQPPPPPPCTYQLTPESAVASPSGGSGEFRVDAPDGCAWTAVPNDAWLTIASGAQGSGAGTVVYQLTKHGGTTDRTGTITVADRTFTVRQSGFDPSGCVYTVTPVEFTPCLLAGSVKARVDTGDSCPWTVNAEATWMTLSGGGDRTGPGDIDAQYTSNYSAPREAFILVRWPTVTAGQNVRVAQAGCLYATSVSVMAIGAAGGSFSFNVFQQAVPNNCGGPLQDACVWSATTTAPWVTITSTMPRQGDNPVAFTVAPNTGTQLRTATIVVQDRTVLIEQAGTP
ncbi:MAG: BACON domain-containing protein [Acidobacteria bacterium]|nr:BACON domain-containing protein [Acidobacteriota bacterium]